MRERGEGEERERGERERERERWGAISLIPPSAFLVPLSPVRSLTRSLALYLLRLMAAFNFFLSNSLSPLSLLSKPVRDGTMEAVQL